LRNAMKLALRVHLQLRNATPALMAIIKNPSLTFQLNASTLLQCLQDTFYLGPRLPNAPKVAKIV